jgi:hypothetical protein
MKTKTCARCGRRVVEAQDDCGLWIEVEPRPVGRMGEALALLAHRRTYEIRLWGGRYSVGHRDLFRIRGAPAGSAKRIDTVVEHDCDAEPIPHIASQLHLPETNIVDLIDPPF